MAERYGHVKLSRKMFQGGVFWQEDRQYSRAEAWIDLIRTAAYKRHRKVVAGHVVTIPRGKLLASERYLADRWQWSRGKVRRYLELLEDMGRIDVERDHEAAHLGAMITLVNYNTYQVQPTANGPPHGPQVGPGADQGRTEEKDKRRQEKNNPQPRRVRARSNLADWTGDTDAVDAFHEEFGSESTTWALAVHGNYGPNAAKPEVWGSVPEADRPKLMSATLWAYVGDAETYDNRLFRRYLERMVREYWEAGEGKRGDLSAADEKIIQFREEIEHVDLGAAG